MIICTAATKNSRYERLLRKQKEHYKDRIHTVLFPMMSWGEGTKIKPKAVREAFTVDPIVLWMDADCRVDLPSKPPDGDWDICLFDNIHPHHINKITAAFILFRHTERTHLFLDTWDENNKLVNKDHPALTKTITELKDSVKMLNATDWLTGRQVINALLPQRGLYK